MSKKIQTKIAGSLFAAILIIGGFLIFNIPKSFAAGDDVTWATSANTLPVALSYATSVLSGNKIYVVGGVADSGFTDAVYIGTIGDDGDVTWTTSANTLPVAVADASSARSGNKIYIIGGTDSNLFNVNTVYIGTIGSDDDVTWTTSANTLPAAMYATTSVTVDNKIYVMGGVADSGLTDAVYIGTIGDDGDVTWTTSAHTLPVAITATSVMSGNRIYVMGGDDDQGFKHNTVYIGTIGDDGDVTWTTSANTLPTVISNANSVSSGNKIYVMGGYDGSGLTDAVYIGTISDDGDVTWTTSANTLPVALSYATSVLSGNKIYVVGGGDAVYIGTPNITVTDPTPDKLTAQITGGNITIPGSDPTAIPSFTVNVDLTLQTGDASVTFPADTVVTKTGGGNLDLTQLTTIDNTTLIQAQLDDILGALKIGIPDLHLTFSQPVTVTIPVGSSHNGQTLQVVFQEDGTTTWTPETTCTISNGNCVFETAHATTFAVEGGEVAPAVKVYTKARISDWDASLYTDQSRCSDRLRLDITGKHFQKNATVRINGQKASSIKLKNSEKLTASFCLDDLTNNQIGSKRSIYVTNPHTNSAKAEKKIDIDTLTENVGTANLDPSTPEGVKNIQQVLVKLGYLDRQNVTGTYGPLTTQAVKKFQADNGLPQTGTVGPLTKAKLGEKA